MKAFHITTLCNSAIVAVCQCNVFLVSRAILSIFSHIFIPVSVKSNSEIKRWLVRSYVCIRFCLEIII